MDQIDEKALPHIEAIIYSMTPEERIQARAERRAAAEKKRAENIKKRAEKAAEYERQVKLREEQKKNSVTGDLVPRL